MDPIQRACYTPSKTRCWYHGPKYILSFTIQEKEKFKQMGIRETEANKWVLPDGQEMLPKSLALQIL